MKKKTLILLACVMSMAFHTGLAKENKKGRIPPAMGWSSWNTYHVNISDSLIRKQAHALVTTGLDKHGYRYINIDDGYFGGRDAAGRLLTHPERFPEGLRPTVEYIHSLGLKAGIYSDAGRNTCGFYYDNDTIAHGVGMLGFERKDAEFFFNDMGFDFIKVDFCGGNGLGGEPELDEKERYTAIAEAIKNTGRKDIVMNVCRWDYPGTWVNDIAGSWRISHDIRPRWNSIKDIISQNLYLSAYSGHGGYNDMDMLEVGRGLTEEEDRTHFGMWCMMSSPLLIGKDLTTLDAPTLALLSNASLIALNQGNPMNQAYVTCRQGRCYALVKDIEEENGNSRAVAFYNAGDTPSSLTIYFHELDLDGKVTATDLFNNDPAGTFIDCMTVEVPPHATRIYRLSAERRLQRKRYEAETAYITDYQELLSPLHAKTGFYVEDDCCSGGAKAVNLGGKPENDIVWSNVYVEKTGYYDMAVKTMSDTPASLLISVNNQEKGSLSFSGAETKTLRIKLRKGKNTVRLHNDTARMPDIDYIEILRKAGPQQTAYISGMTVEGRENHPGCDTYTPRLGWRIESPDSCIRQTAYRIIVSSDEKKANLLEGDIWDSGTVTSGQSQWVEYSGDSIQPGKEYFWRVKILTERGESRWSPTAVWRSGLLGTQGQGGKWIGFDGLEEGDSMERHSRLRGRYLRKEFATEGKIKKAMVHMAGLGFYDLAINGENISGHTLVPSPTDFTKSIIYNTYDVTDYIKERNSIGVTLAPGYFYAMAQNYQTNVRTTYGFPKMWMLMTLEYVDGRTDTVVSDETWRLYTDGPLRYSNIYDGEFHDSRKELTGWNLPGFDDSAWRSADIVDKPGGTLIGNITPPVSSYAVEKPKKIRRTEKGWLIDFGTNNTGQVEFKDNGQSGDTITIRHAELTCDGDTSLYTENLRSAQCTDYYVSDGKRRTWHPAFTWQGFRYAEISPAEKVDTASIRRYLIADELDDNGMDIEFISQDTVMNMIIQNAKRGILSNYKGMPIDCPQRDERMPWLGDRTTGALGESYVVDNHALYSKWMKDIRECQRADGAISDVAPAYWRLYNYNMTWPAALPMICDMIYRQYGDIKPMEQSFSHIDRWLEFIKSKSMEDGLLTYDRYGDWCMPPESPELIHSNDPDRITDGSLTASCYYYYISKLMSSYGKLLGETQKADHYEKEAEQIRHKINEKFLHDGKYSNSTVTANLLPLATGVVPDSLRQTVAAEIINSIKTKHDAHISCGVIGMQWLMRQLSECGNDSLAWEMATKETYPGWGYMVNKGATTIWELWNGDTADKSMNSGNHVMLLGDLLPWCYENLAGIAPDREEPGFRKIIMRPAFHLDRLNGVKASHKSPYGVIRSEWIKENGTIKWHISIPANCEATLYLPDGRIRHIGSGDRTIITKL